MAWTTTKLTQYAVGNINRQEWLLVADSATLELSTGLKYLLGAHKQVLSGASANHNVGINRLSAATASNGTLSLTGCVSGESYYVVISGN